MKIVQTEIALTSPRRGTYNITNQVNRFVKESGLNTGLCHVFIQ
ncbi:MAG TPA: YjbQ family protein, partial [Thiomicrospira sp.]|nr:YjbQ family protein [Thiomicrospira sp.]